MRFTLFGKKSVFRAPGTSDRTDRSRAKKHNIAAPTFPLIVYMIILVRLLACHSKPLLTCAQVHHALSGERLFRASGGSFDYEEFYYDILSFVRTQLDDDERKAILAWYQE
jgi:hypothetical protein